MGRRGRVARTGASGVQGRLRSAAGLGLPGRTVHVSSVAVSSFSAPRPAPPPRGAFSCLSKEHSSCFLLGGE